MGYSLSNYTSFLLTAYNNALKEETFGSVETWAHAYELVFALISKDENGNSILTLDPNDNNQLLDRNNNAVDLENWTLANNEPDWASWTKIAPEVDAAAWVFLKGVPFVNRNDDTGAFADYNEFIRVYSKIQYGLRFDDAPQIFSQLLADEGLADKVQDASNRIAQAILRDILNLDPDPNNQSNPNNNLPDIDGIAGNDAEAAAENLFNQPGTIAGWAGNPFFALVGLSLIHI